MSRNRRVTPIFCFHEGILNKRYPAFLHMENESEKCLFVAYLELNYGGERWFDEKIDTPCFFI